MALKNMPGYTDKVFCLETAILYGVVWFELDLERIGGGSDQVWEYFSTKSPERFVGSIAIRDLYIIVLTFLLREKKVVWLLPSIILDETQSTIVITHLVGKKPGFIYRHRFHDEKLLKCFIWETGFFGRIILTFVPSISKWVKLSEILYCSGALICQVQVLEGGYMSGKEGL